MRACILLVDNYDSFTYNLAHLQAGAGIVADSDPTAEHQECLNKLAALEHAIEMAEEPR